MDYLPPVLREVMEMQAINEANEPEIAIAWDALALVLSNQFLETADVRGVSVWEKELKIFPKDTNTLEERKAHIKAIWGQQSPYTTRWLKRWLDGICGPTGHRETVEEYKFDLWLDVRALQKGNISAMEIAEMLKKVLPANLWWQLTLTLTMQSDLCVGGGGVGIQAQAGIPLQPDGPDFSGVLRAGGTVSVRSKLFAPGDGDPPPVTTILRTGGVCTIISNLSRGG